MRTFSITKAAGGPPIYGSGALLLLAWFYALPSSLTAQEPPARPIINPAAAAEGKTGEQSATSSKDAGGFESETNPQYVSRARVERPTEQTTSCAETIDVAAQASTAGSVAETLSQAGGVQVRRLGGPGSRADVSIRGSTPNQVPIYLDGVQLNAGGFSSVDLGQLSLDTLESMEIYRGSAPLALGPGGIGGAVQLRTRDFDRPMSEAAVTYGSFSTARAMAARADRIGPANALLLFSEQGSEGDFKYLNRNGTRDASDDRIQERENNQHLAYDGLVKLGGANEAWKWTAADELHEKRQGLAGIESVPTRLARLNTLRDTAQANLNGPISKSTTLSLDAGVLGIRDDLNDPNNEIGVGVQHTVSYSNAVSAAAMLEMTHSPRNLSRFRVDGRYQRFTWNEMVCEARSRPQERLSGAAGLEHEWRPQKDFALVPAARAELLGSRFGGGQMYCGGDELRSDSFSDLLFSPSLGARWQALRGLVLRGNVGRYARAPDLTELFGNRGVTVGNPDLKPEAAINADLGATYTVKKLGALSTLRMGAAWFGSWVKDLIGYVQNSQNTIRPENVDSAEILGVESGLRMLWYNLVSLQGNYTYQYAVNNSDAPYYHGQRLPGRPAYEAYGKVEASRTFNDWGGGLWFDADYADEDYLDQANLKQVSPRLLLGVGARVERLPEGLTLTVEIDNLLDTIAVSDPEGRRTPLRDVEGFPLPGRAVFATLHWKM